MVNVTEIKVYMARRDGMTNKQLAEQLGISPATLARWFDKQDMPTSAAEKMIAALKIPTSEATGIFLRRCSLISYELNGRPHKRFSSMGFECQRQ